ncbi:putative polyketide synthase 3 [Portunus trituberculatus]|uniref:Putative polyketide synthase 3 n=1 Tax=Portunus trituberculatus TaxID=210409 RepID=A0A5B7GF28_PORTR|nr:putative polyketide synthase 3 [Portunus trituberculatus]
MKQALTYSETCLLLHSAAPHDNTALPACLPPFLPPCLPPSLPPWLFPCLPVYLSSSLPACLPACLPAFLPPCLPAFLPPSLPACLPACRGERSTEARRGEARRSRPAPVSTRFEVSRSNKIRDNSDPSDRLKLCTLMFK